MGDCVYTGSHITFKIIRYYYFLVSNDSFVIKFVSRVMYYIYSLYIYSLYTYLVGDHSDEKSITRDAYCSTQSLLAVLWMLALAVPRILPLIIRNNANNFN